jgi:hypothetical protein
MITLIARGRVAVFAVCGRVLYPLHLPLPNNALILPHHPHHTYPPQPTRSTNRGAGGQIYKNPTLIFSPDFKKYHAFSMPASIPGE